MSCASCCCNPYNIAYASAALTVAWYVLCLAVMGQSKPGHTLSQAAEDAISVLLGKRAASFVACLFAPCYECFVKPGRKHMPCLWLCFPCGLKLIAGMVWRIAYHLAGLQLDGI